MCIRDSSSEPCTGVSMPSATVVNSRLRARSRTARTRAICRRSRSSAGISDRSIFNVSIGRSRRYASDEYPVPKSSIAIRTPSARSVSRCASAWTVW